MSDVGGWAYELLYFPDELGALGLRESYEMGLLDCWMGCLEKWQAWILGLFVIGQ